MNGFKEKENLALILLLTTCKYQGKDDLMVYSSIAYFGDHVGYLIKTDHLTADDDDDHPQDCGVLVKVGKESPGNITSAENTQLLFIWTDTKQVAPLIWNPSSENPSICTYEKVEEILREAFNADPTFEMTLYDDTDQKKTLEEYRQGKVGNITWGG